MKWLLLVGVVAAGMGCDSKPSGLRERQDAALKDPWNYSPYEKADKNDLSGGGLMELQKDALKRDVNSVFSP